MPISTTPSFAVLAFVAGLSLATGIVFGAATTVCNADQSNRRLKWIRTQQPIAPLVCEA
jgi:hypothetical protein